MSAPVEIPAHGLRDALIELIHEGAAAHSTPFPSDDSDANARDGRGTELTRLLDLVDAARRSSASSSAIVVDAVKHGRAARMALERIIDRAELETETATDEDAEAVGETLWHLREARLAHDALLMAAERIAPGSSVHEIGTQHELPETALGPDKPCL